MKIETGSPSTWLQDRASQLRAGLGRQLVPTLLNRFGVAPAPRSRFLVGQRSLLLSSLDITHVIDVGANVGQYATELRRAGFAGLIDSFEPGHEPRATLRAAARKDPRWRVHGVALGETAGAAQLMTWAGPSNAAASLRTPTSGLRSILGEPVTEQVEVTTLDQWLSTTDCNLRRTLLKIDVQGFEAQVLAGSTHAMERLAAIEMELPLQQMYEEQSTMAEILNAMDAAGYAPATIMTERFHSGWLGAVDVDAIFVRKELSPLQRERVLPGATAVGF